MDSKLLRIQDTVMKYVRIISKIVKVEVEVVDSNLYRIAGTGIYEKEINKDMSSEGYVYKHVLASGERQIVFEPGKDDLCINCPDKENCKEKFEVSTPIKIKENIIGVIGMICNDEEQKKVLQKNLSIYLELLDQIADFIAVKAYEVEEANKNKAILKILNKIINEINKGVIIFNNNGNITSINEYAKKIIGITDFDFGEKKINIIATGDWINKNREYKLEIDKKSFTVVGYLNKISDGEELSSKVFIFSGLTNIEYHSLEIIPSAYSYDKSEIIGSGEKTSTLKNQIKNIANSPSTVLITGESGTGKSVVAESIWSEGNRKNNKFVTINCSSASEKQLEKEMFGYVNEGNDNEEISGQIGKFELADNGVVFLDEIADLPLYLQSKLIRVIEENKITRLGSEQDISLNVRIIASTNKDIPKLIEENKFRSDLYYRLNIIPIKIYPLRERTDDIEELIYYFIEKYSAVFNKNFKKIDGNVIELLKKYNWDGNVRELKNTAEFMVNMMEKDGVINQSTLPGNILNLDKDMDTNEEESEIISLKNLEKKEIFKAIKVYGNTVEGKKMAAKKLGIGIATLYRKMENYNIL